MHKSKRNIPYVLNFLFIALFLHLLFLPILEWLIREDEKQEDTLMSVMLHEPDTLPETESKRTDEELPLPTDEEQVVELETANELKPLKPTKYLSEKDSRAQIETKAKDLGIPREKTTSTISETQPEAVLLPEEPTDIEDISQPGGLKIDPQFLKPTPTVPPLKLTPSPDVMAKATRGSGLDDLEDILSGDDTFLNSRSFRFAQFFNRVKQQVEQFWQPVAAVDLHDPGYRIYGGRDRTTVLLVSLNPDGSLNNLYVVQPSGAPFLDDEAMKAVTMGAPFPNVPTGLLNKETKLARFLFQFTLTRHRSPVFRSKRYD